MERIIRSKGMLLTSCRERMRKKRRWKTMWWRNDTR